MGNKLLIIQPSHYHSKHNHTVFKSRRRSLVPLALPYLAAITPREWDVTLVDEQIQDIDFDCQPDLVAITSWTVHSIRGYDVAREFRQRGIPVIMGGPHVWFHPEEAAEHCDAIGIGEGEPIWTQMLNDAASGRLQKVYRAPQMTSLAGLPTPRWDLLDLHKYGPFKTFTLMSSRGCPMQCEFCSERLYLGGGFRIRPVDDVIEEIKRCGSKNIFFGDSDFGGKRVEAMKLMEAMIPLKLRWSALWTSFLCYDDDYMDLAERSGLLHINIGIESINPSTLKGMNKKFNKVDKYGLMLENLRRRGISYSLNFIFGWDNETPEVFGATFDFLQRERVPVAYFNILCPEKGTMFYENMKKDDRILRLEDIGRFPGEFCHIKPKNFTATELEKNVQDMYVKFYSWRSMFKRLPMPVSQANIASWLVNLSQRNLAQRSVGNHNNNFDAY
ncbi:MAG TPA: radical SAM protein [Candidatus Eremiobacteraceae bacterium]|nr:radical SAM protein [Candidatus Eremiobacteraceae bacterium]